LMPPRARIRRGYRPSPQASARSLNIRGTR
jgi:hypothetical protein